MSLVLLGPVDGLSSSEISEIDLLARDCADREVAPMLAIRVQSLLEDFHSGIRIVRAQLDGRLVGVGLVNLGGSAAPGCVIAVAPGHRLRGLGSEILRYVRKEVTSGKTRIWNHGDCESGFRFADAHGMKILQQLHLMEVRNSLSMCPAHLDPRADCTIRVVDSSDLPSNWSQIVDESYLSPTVATELSARPWWPESKVVVAELNDGFCVGLLVLRDIVYRGVKSIENHLMAVHPDARGLGIGRDLTTASLIFAREASRGFSISYVDRQNAAAVQAHLNAGFLTVSSDSVFEYSW